MKDIEKKAKEFTDYLYDAYGSGTGVLFGIPSNCRDSVYAIVKLVMERNFEQIEEEEQQDNEPEGPDNDWRD